MITTRGRTFAVGLALGALIGVGTLLPDDLLSEPQLPNITRSPFPGMQLVPTPQYEDEPGWDCRTDGNRTCGPWLIITGPCVQYKDGATTCRDAADRRWWRE